IDDWQQVVDWLREHPAEQVTLRIARAGEQLELPLTLGAKGEGEARVGYLGVGVKGGEWPARMLHEVSFGPLDGVAESLRRTWNMTLLTLDSLKKMLFGELSVKNLSGPITIAKV